MIGGSDFWQKDVDGILVSITDLEVVGARVVTTGDYDAEGGECNITVFRLNAPFAPWISERRYGHWAAIRCHETRVNDLLFRGSIWNVHGS